MLLRLHKVLPTPVETLLLVRLVAIPSLVLPRAEVLDLLAGVSDFVEAEGRARAFEEVALF